VFGIIWFVEGRQKREKKFIQMENKKYVSIVAIFAVVVFAGCKVEPERIVPGKDVCADCKMAIVDPKFGGEIITKKGKVYKFDDTHCIASFLKQRTVELDDVQQTLFANYNKPDEFINVTAAEFVVSSQLASPMGGNAAAFPDKTLAAQQSAQIEGSKTTNWATLYNILVK
jgi:copper chaperone NosL